MKRTTSAETAASFVARRAKRDLEAAAWAPRLPPALRRATERLAIDFARTTVEELLSCVLARVRYYERRDLDVPHITEIARRMLREALEAA